LRKFEYCQIFIGHILSVGVTAVSVSGSDESERGVRRENVPVERSEVRDLSAFQSPPRRFQHFHFQRISQNLVVNSDQRVATGHAEQNRIRV